MLATCCASIFVHAVGGLHAAPATLGHLAAARSRLALPHLFEQTGATWNGFEECFLEAKPSQLLVSPMAIGHRGNKLTIQVRSACLPRPCFCSEPAPVDDQPLRFNLVAVVCASCSVDTSLHTGPTSAK
jgi:hypothetical protein